MLRGLTRVAALLLLCFCAIGRGASLLPDLVNDGISVNPTDFRIGQKVVVTSLTSWRVFSNDNFDLKPNGLYGDYDYNDFVFDVFFGLNGDGIAKYVTELTGYQNYAIIEGQVMSSANQTVAFGPQAIGSTLNVVLVVNGSPSFTMPHANFMTERIYPPGDPGPGVPEPGTLALIGLGLTALGAIRHKKSR